MLSSIYMVFHFQMDTATFSTHLLQLAQDKYGMQYCNIEVTKL
jgi:hypothetical protein